MSSSLSSAHHWKLWSECGTGPFTDGSVGHNGSPSHYVQWPTKPGQLGHSHPTEQGGHCHQPGPTGDPGQTSGAGCHQHWHIGLFTTDVPVNHSLESSLVLVRLDVLMFCSCGFFFGFFLQGEESYWCVLEASVKLSQRSGLSEPQDRHALLIPHLSGQTQLPTWQLHGMTVPHQPSASPLTSYWKSKTIIYIFLNHWMLPFWY